MDQNSTNEIHNIFRETANTNVVFAARLVINPLNQSRESSRTRDLSRVFLGQNAKTKIVLPLYHSLTTVECLVWCDAA